MDYKKKYEEANDKVAARFGTNVAKEIFTDLYESEDERIRKEIIEFLQLPHRQFVGNKKQEGWIAWLEKQGERKPQDDSAPKTNKEEQVSFFKFHKGDWIVTNDGKDVFFIRDVSCGYCSLEDTNGNILSNCQPFESDFHLWTIQDAKDGDVLVASDGSIFLFAGTVDCACKYYVALTTDNNIKINKEIEGGYWETSRAVHPATKKQRDLLFQKMKEAGYEWDAEKKELKKINSYCEEHCKGFQETGKCYADGECKAKRDAEQNLAWS